ncbi:MAG: hypothetical protein LBJ00_02245 [Planctomycetaceae bacterium]|nr:hypothetical protein [Planctomycetaceae bacterium]
MFKGEAYRPYRLRYSTQMTQILEGYSQDQKNNIFDPRPSFGICVMCVLYFFIVFCMEGGVLFYYFLIIFSRHLSFSLAFFFMIP